MFASVNSIPRFSWCGGRPPSTLATKSVPPSSVLVGRGDECDELAVRRELGATAREGMLPLMTRFVSPVDVRGKSIA